MRLDSPLELLREIDPICERFEAALRTQSKPRIEDYLEESRPEVRATLLAHLLELELDYRDRRGSESCEAPASACPDDAGAQTTDGSQFPMLPELLRSPGTRFGPFLLLRELGRGGMGIVYEALQPELDRRVALKLMSPGLVAQPDFLKRFRREARAAARLHHSHIVQLYEFGQESAVPYIAFQLVEGGSLADRLYEERRAETGTPLGRERAREIAKLGSEIASALAYAHGLGVLHRDLKPANILLDASGTAYLGDFGLARIEEDERSQPSGIVGTLRYMAPESLRGEADARSDIYSLGATLYDWAALLPLDEPRDTSGGLASERVIPLRKRRAGIPRDLETILLRALEPEPRRRFASAAELAAELEAFLGDRPITSRRPSPIERWWRWQRRNPLLGAALLALALCLLALGVGSTFAATSFRQAAHELLLRSQSEERLRLDLAAQLSSSEIARAFRALQDPASHGELAQIVSREKARRGGTLPPSWEWRLIDAVASQRHRECGGPEDGLDVLGLQPGGRWLAAAGSSLHFFDTVEERWHPERDVSLRSAGLSWNASGRYLGIASVGAHVLDFETGELVCDLGEPEVDRIAMHPHRPLFAVALRTRDLVLYDWREQREILRLERALVPLWRFGFSPSGDELAFLCPSGVGILRIEDGSVRHLAYREVLFHMPVIWHPSGKVIAMGIADGAALLDARNGTLLRVLSTGSRFPVDLAFDEAGRRMALTARDNAIHLFGLDPETLLEPQPTRTADRVLSGIETSTSGARIDARGQRVYAGARSRPLHVWDLDDAAPFRSFGTRTASGPYIALGLHWEESSRSLWSSTRAGARCWSPTGEARGESMVGTRTPTPSADERWLALVSGSRLRVLDRNTRQLFREAEHAAHFLAWHPREPRLYSADPFEIRAWELRNESTPRTLGRSELRLFDMDLSADGRFLWFARGEDFAGFDTESGIFHPVERPDAALGVVIVEAHPQAPLVACGYDDGSFQVYDAELRRFHPRRKGHGLRIRDFAWSPDGARLASVSSDASIRLWDPLRGEELATLRGPCVMAKVCWSNDGDVLAALSDEGHILVWDAGAAEAESLPR